MQISKTSWHYRFNKWQNDNFSSRFNRGHYTTCSYIRTTIASTFACLFKAWIILLVISCILGLIGCMVVVPIMIFLGSASIPELPGVMCVVGWLMVIVILAIVLVNQIKNWIDNLETKFKDRPVKEPNVFVQAVIDKHNKFCTRVVAED